jgi:hypothetical protein
MAVGAREGYHVVVGWIYRPRPRSAAARYGSRADILFSSSDSDCAMIKLPSSGPRTRPSGLILGQSTQRFGSSIGVSKRLLMDKIMHWNRRLFSFSGPANITYR